MEEVEIHRSQSFSPLCCGAPLCLQHFKYSSIPRLTKFICVCLQRALHFKTIASDPSCIGNNALRLWTQLILLFSNIVPPLSAGGGTKGTSLILHWRSILSRLLTSEEVFQKRANFRPFARGNDTNRKSIKEPRRTGGRKPQSGKVQKSIAAESKPTSLSS